MLRASFTAVALLLPVPVFAAGVHCGYSPDDWCTSAQDGPCGRHMTADSCRADGARRGMEYRGESVVACR